MGFSTPLPALCRELVGLMAHAIETGAANAPGQTFLPFDIYLPEWIARHTKGIFGTRYVAGVAVAVLLWLERAP